MPILVFLGLSVLDLGPMYATDVRQTDVGQYHRLMLPPRGAGLNKIINNNNNDNKNCSDASVSAAGDQRQELQTLQESNGILYPVNFRSSDRYIVRL